MLICIIDTMLLDERENRILGFLVRDFIKTAEPVSSARVRDGLGLNESPATIRNIVADLDEAGFLEQPYTSAGRVPTDMAYRYFVDNLMFEVKPDRKVLNIKKLTSRRGEVGRFLAEALNLLSFTGFEGEHFSGHGFSGLFKEPEFKDEDSMLDVGYFIDHIDELADAYRKQAKNTAGFFIGKENPASCAREFGVFYVESAAGSRKQTVILVGPKRMNYERVSSYAGLFLD